MVIKKDNLKKELSLIILEDYHHHHEQRQIIEDLVGKGSVKPILVLNTDKHTKVWIVTPNALIEIVSGKREGEDISYIRILPELWNRKTGKTLALMSFDDRREAHIEVKGERVKDQWKSWFKEE